MIVCDEEGVFYDLWCYPANYHKAPRQAVESVNAQIRTFNSISRWKKESTLIACLLGYAIGYSFFRKHLVEI